MVYEISSIDLLALLPELQQLEGSRISKIYQRDNEIILDVYKSGDKKYSLFLAAGKAFLTNYKRKVPEIPPNFCMFLRKYLLGKYITKIKQRSFDRVLEIQIEHYILICEIFGSGNFILVSHEKILAAMHPKKWKDRSIFRGELYKAPPSSLDPRLIKPESFANIRNFDKPIVSALSTIFGIGGNYAEEVLYRTGVDKNTSCKTLEIKQLNLILHTLIKLILGVNTLFKPNIVYKDGEPLLVLPIDFFKYKNFEKTYFETFSRALDEYYTSLEKKESIEEFIAPQQNKVEELERIKKQQIETLSKLENEHEKSKEKADLIYRNYSLVETIISALNSARGKYDQKEIEEKLSQEKARGGIEAGAVISINFATKMVLLDLEQEIEVDFSLGVEKNAERYYEQSKQANRKMGGLRKALEETKLKLNKLESKEIPIQSESFRPIYSNRKKYWYETFRWYFTKENILVIGGKDAMTNEILIKKYTESTDIVMHAELPGAPFVVIKSNGGNISEEVLKEAAIFGISYSSSWSKGIGNADIYYIKPEQVVKVPGLSKGAFQIQGKRNYIYHAPLELAIGLLEKDSDLRIMGGPINSVKDVCKTYVIIKYGVDKKSDIAKKIKFYFEKNIKEKIDLDEIIRALPPGNCKIERYSEQINRTTSTRS